MTSVQNCDGRRNQRKQIVAYCALLSVFAAVASFSYISRSRREYPGGSRVSCPSTSIAFTILDPRRVGAPGGSVSDPHWEYRVFLVDLLVFRDGSVKSFAEWEQLTPPFDGVIRHFVRQVFPEYTFSHVEGNLWYPTAGVQYSMGFCQDVVENVFLLRSEREDNKWHILKVSAEDRNKVISSGLVVDDILKLPVVESDPMGAKYVAAFQAAKLEDSKLRDLGVLTKRF